MHFSDNDDDQEANIVKKGGDSSDSDEDMKSTAAIIDKPRSDPKSDKNGGFKNKGAVSEEKI